jgi:hypothetical protein
MCVLALRYRLLILHVSSMCNLLGHIVLRVTPAADWSCYVLYEPVVSYHLQLPSEGPGVAGILGILCTGKGHMRHQELTAQSARSRGLRDD